MATQSFIKTIKSPAWAIKLLSERVLPVLFSPRKVAGELSARKDVDTSYGLETGTVTMTVMYLFAYAISLALLLCIVIRAYALFDSQMFAVMFLTIVVGNLIQVPIGVAIGIVVSLLGVGAIWWIGKKLGGKAEFGRFYGVLMPAVSLMVSIYLLSTVIFISSFVSLILVTDGLDSSVFKIFVAIIFACHLLTLIYLTAFTAKAHDMPTAKALLTCLVALSPLILMVATQAMMFATAGF
jgi:hypothetical protein